ncbi:bactofilin family protein [Candidatus Methylacidithermus pantelleriae]|uniref:Integral membrane protein CcmA involved in cell shape determination n=1 Tax=Candidatus Methylacidithermus pantelleriae TaxID=2744239 RepID=A0A8J2BKE4_9BACT|nr:polymer-forming cytoskeletal protein [Candidatus Methylacidithermus pantelleriae]CAF0692948.1 Integral membrane protein CcmA involved in cell shape determination [Candidatus Methylacidithermus pantelleriae]
MSVFQSQGFSERKPSGSASRVTVLTKDTEFCGSVAFTGELELNGKVEGELLSEDGRLVVGESGIVQAQIRAREVVIAGTVCGNVVATERVQLQRTGKLYGDVSSPILVVEEGALFVGRSEPPPEKRGEAPHVRSLFRLITPKNKEKREVGSPSVGTTEPERPS